MGSACKSLQATKKIIMQTIFKYQLTPEQTVELPVGAQILYAGMQHGGLFIWALVDDAITQMEIREMKVYGTGQAVNYPVGGDKGIRFINTIITMGGQLVLHVFDTNISHAK